MTCASRVVVNAWLLRCHGSRGPVHVVEKDQWKQGSGVGKNCLKYIEQPIVRWSKGIECLDQEYEMGCS